jgi:hypothetical protein
MRAKVLTALVAALVGLGSSHPAVAGGMEDSAVESRVIRVPTAVYYPAPLRHKRCGRRVDPRCNAHAFVVYSYAGTDYPRYYYRWRGYGWNR